MNRTLRLLTAVTGLALVTGFAFANEPFQWKKEQAKKGWLGVSIQDVNEKIAKKNKLTAEEGAYVNDVVDESPADSAGLKEGDVIVKFGDRDIYDSDDLIRSVSRTSPGTRTNVGVIRNGEKKSMAVVVGKERMRRGSAFTVRTMPHLAMFGNNVLGLRLSNLNEQLGEYFGAPDKRGVLVEEVEEESSGAKAGFKAGDVITRAGKRTVEDTDDISKELRKHEEGDKVEFEVLRKGAKKNLTAEIEEDNEFAPGTPNMRMNVHPKIQMFRSRPGGSDFEFNLQHDESPFRETEQLKIDAEKVQRELQLHRRSLEQYSPKTIVIAPRRNEI